MRTLKVLAVNITVLLLLAGIAYATPSTTYWTPATTDIQPYGVMHLGIDNYFTVFKKEAKGGGSFPVDFGLTMGVLPYEKIQMELGVDLLESSDYPLYFNAKLGTPEDSLFSGSPALNVGIVNVGTKNNVTNQNIIHVMAGKTIPGLGRFFAGYYTGNKKVLVNKDGNKANTGFMIGFDRGFMAVKDKDGSEYSKLVLAADYATGKNAFGGGGIGLYYYFTKDISLLTGPVWFNEEALNGKWKWTLQLDVNLPVFGK